MRFPQNSLGLNEECFIDLFWCVDDSCVVSKLQGAYDSGAHGEQEVACHLLFLTADREDGQSSEDRGRRKEADSMNMKPELRRAFAALQQTVGGD